MEVHDVCVCKGIHMHCMYVKEVHIVKEVRNVYVCVNEVYNVCIVCVYVKW